MRPYQTTHRATIQHREETGETADDGMGGTRPRVDWVTRVADMPIRYLPEGVGLERQRHGDVYRDNPSMLCPPQYVGQLVDGEFSLNIDVGDDWRVGIEGVTGPDTRRSITNRRPLYGKATTTVPVAIHFELESLRD